MKVRRARSFIIAEAVGWDLRGDASKIARIHRVSRTHVEQVAAGERQGRASLLETIRRYQERAKLAPEAV